ncbi:GPI ethanolamine phosphate transferase 2-like [Diprion similis]|uniref:GPI ethanolamine phosphate transferase 2-like n=1 Tax=Diprion similis TaxID=362088 RepID=UPI001EF7C40D|nr:GPI ethanolamine phosphate transferase 2-like [Diprion similis]
MTPHERSKRDGPSRSSFHCCTLLYAMFVTLFSALLFLYGFFPLKLQDAGIASFKDIPNHVEHIRVNNELLYKPVINKLIFMVIDGLRWDFVAGPIGQAGMPITRSLIQNDSACLLQTKVGSPTVTMPRIKAITTGTAPTFVDVVLNFGSTSISGDSLLLQAKNHGHKLVFFGDDTWLRLFPGIFDRHDGTTSFFVTDYTEVDDNVTRHIDGELNKDDWSIMVLHYLGLDHIGHIGGPQSPLIKPKLREMDEIIGRINAKVVHWHSKNEPALFIVCGDHGMKDSGGHGGNTPQETLVPFVAIGASCPENDNQPVQIDQIDISSTLAVMLGIPIPASSLGSISLNVLRELSTSRKLFSLYYNAKQVFNHFKRLTGFKATGAYEKYSNAIKLHTAWLETNGLTNETVDEIVFSYTAALRGMRNKLTSSMTKYDLHVMTIAMFFMFHVLYIITNTQQDSNVILRKIYGFLIINVILWISVDYLLQGSSESLLLSNDTNSNLILTVIVVILFGNCYLCTKRKLSADYLIKILKSKGTAQCLLTMGTIIHALSFISSSFIEEEHRTWYFFWTTFCILLLYNIVKSLVAQSPRYFYGHSLQVNISIQLFLCLSAHAVLRQLNSTGDMYAHLPDIADWLQQESKIYMSTLLISALSMLVWIGHIHEELKYKKYSLALYVALAVCVYLRHMGTEAVLRIPFYPASKGIVEVQFFWCSMLVFLTCSVFRLGSKIQEKRNHFLSLLLRFVLESWVMASTMLHRPYNVVLLPIQILFSIVIHAALRGNKNRNIITHIFYWLGNVFYFYQGNSNNLSTIDIAAGYVGVESYNIYITGLFLVINTYSAPVLAYLTLLYVVACENKNPKSLDDVLEINRMYAVFRLLPLAVYTIVVSIHRYHLFIWTVFSPKLLYEAMYCMVMYIVMLTMNATFILHDKINEY